MKRKLKLLTVLVLSVLVMIFACSCGCMAKRASDTHADSSDVSDDHSAQQNDEVPQVPPVQPNSAAQTPSLPDPQVPSADGPDASSGGTGSADGTGGIVEPSSKTLIVIIEEDQVFINGIEYKDANDLKSYIESVNNDSRLFKLYEDHAIQATHDWVLKVFRELQVEIIAVRDT